MELSPEELAAAQASMLAQKNELPTVVDPPIVDEPPPANNNNEPPANNSSLTPEQEAAAKAQADAKALADAEALKNNPPPAKTFEEELSERFEGKFKTVDELKAIVNAPKEEIDEEILHYQNLKKSGVKLDKEFFELQNLNLEPDSDGTYDPEFLVLEAARRKPENKGLSERALRNIIDKKYNVSEWIDKDEADYTEDDLTNKEIMMRDALNDFEFLSKLKSERTFVSPVNAEQQQALAEERRQVILGFEKMVDDDFVSKAINLSTEIQIDDKTKEVYEYKVSEAIRSEAAKVMKMSVQDLGVLVNQFAEKDAEGNIKINDRKVFEMLVLPKIYNEAVQNAYKDGMAHGAKNFVKNDLKNANFKPQDNPSGNGAPTSEAEALAQSMKASGQKFT